MAYFDFYLLFFVDLLDRYRIFNQPAWWKLSLFLQYSFILFLFFKIQDSVCLPFYPIYELIISLAFFLKLGKLTAVTSHTHPSTIFSHFKN